MKYCPVCERNYDDEMRVCGLDGTPLNPYGVKESQPALVVGQYIKGRYQILRKLGEGGMGTVYLADQMSIGRKVALKLLRDNYARDQEFIARFRREARLAASLNHRNIVMVLDFDQAENGALFIAMEYVDGIRLSDIIRRDGPLPIHRVIQLGIQIAEGLDAAHRAGVIHRDIKPDNILVTGVPGVEEVKLMDFGIARLRDAISVSQLTQTGMIMGTPAYIAPEQAEGSAVSERTDIYALGVVLYEMLAGSVPFKASTPAALLLKQIQEAPKALRAVRETIPANIERLVMQALEKQPEKRQGDMGEVAQQLQGIARSTADNFSRETMAVPNTILVNDGPRTIAATLAISDTLLEHRTRPPLKFAAIGVVSFVLLAGVVFALSQLLKTTAEPEPIKLPQAVSEIAPVPAEPATVAPTPIPPAQPPASAERRSANKEPPLTKLNKEPPVAKLKKEPPIAKPAKTLSPPRSTDFASPPATQSTTPVEPSPPPAVAKPPGAVSANPKVQEYLRGAKLFRGRGEYSDARAELEKARALEPVNPQVRAELEIVRRACEAERKLLGRPDLSC